jgi:hypothetical protein
LTALIAYPAVNRHWNGTPDRHPKGALTHF